MSLVYDDGHAEIFDGIGFRLGVARQEVTDERAEGLVQLAARFRGNCIENDGRFSRPRYPGEERDFALRNAQGYVLQVVLSRATDFDIFLGQDSLPIVCCRGSSL